MRRFLTAFPLILLAFSLPVAAGTYNPATPSGQPVVITGVYLPWATGAAYVAGQGVSYNGKYYVCTSGLTSTTAPPSDTSHWAVSATTPSGTPTAIMGVNYFGRGHWLA